MGLTALRVDDAWVSYVPRRPVLRGVSLEARAGAVTMVLGMSGSGKTTLLKLCKGLLPAQRGEVRVLGAPVVPAQY
nr:ATP-binding cassette domain-containing protein [Actinomycetota bacterium]